MRRLTLAMAGSLAIALVGSSAPLAAKSVDVTAPPFGALCDGRTDDHDALQAALDSGETVLLPARERVCLTTRSLHLKNGQTLTAAPGGGKAILRLKTSQIPTLIDLTGVSDARIVGLVLDGSAATASPDTNAQAFVVLRNAANDTLDSIVVENAPGTNGVGAITLSGSASHNAITRSTFTNARGSAVVLTGGDARDNRLSANTFRNNGFWGIYLGQGASFNVVKDNDCGNGDGVARAHGGECYAVSVRSDHNTIANNISRGAGDDGVSVSGSYTTVTKNRISGSYYSGVNIWGSNNTIADNWLKNNGQSGLSPIACIGVNGYFGGAGQNNSIVGNHCLDDQAAPTQLGIILARQNYLPWRAGASVRAGQYALNGLRIYQASSSGVTGDHPPVHDHGVADDGAVSWAFVNAFVAAPSASGNIVRGNRVDRFKGDRPYVDGDGWIGNTLQAR